MKNIWIVFLALGVVVAGSWFFRFERTMTSSIADGRLKIVYIDDNWAGQTWISRFGYYGDKERAGELDGHFPQESIDALAKQYIVDPDNFNWEAKLKAEQKARDILNNKALYKRKSITYIWASVTLSLFILSLAFFIKNILDYRQSPVPSRSEIPQNRSFI